jgi:prophage DNA circulation protein
MARVAAIKELKAYATPEEREELEKLEKEVNDFIAGLQKQQELNVEEKEKRLQRYREITEKLYKEIEEEKRRSEEEKRKAEEEERKFSALNTSIRAALDEIKGLMSAAGNAYFAKSYELALTTMREAGERVGALKAKIEENKELLDKFGYYAAYMDQARALENVVNATIKAWQGINPNRELVNAMTNYANSTVQFNRKAAERVERKMVYKVTDPDDVKEMKDVARVERKNAAVGRMLSATTASFLSAVPVIAYQPSKLDPATIVKFRTWLATNRSTPCKAIANYTWNVASGYSYDDKMIYLMRMAAREAGVPWEKLRKLKLREIEAIVRAPQYLYAAAMRGYFTPYEFELYNRLKELLQLTDYQVVQLFKRRGAK